MTRTRLDDAQWASLMLVMQQIPPAWKRDEAALRRFVEAVLWLCRTGAPWRDLPSELGRWPSVYHRWRRWCLRGWWELVFEAVRPALPAEGLLFIDSTTCKAHRAASGAARSTAAAEALGRSRGGLCSKLHACADGAGRILRLVASPGNHSDLRYAAALASGIPARDAALDRGHVSAALRAAFAADGCAVHTPPKRGMVDPPGWCPKLYARRHKVENLFSRLKDWGRIALRRDKTRRSWLSFAHLAATIINLRLAESGHRPKGDAHGLDAGRGSTQGPASRRLGAGRPRPCGGSPFRGSPPARPAMRRDTVGPANMTRRTARRRASLERRIAAAFEQAIADGRPDVAERLLCALEVLASDRTPASVLDRACLLIAEPKDP